MNVIVFIENFLKTELKIQLINHAFVYFFLNSLTKSLFFFKLLYNLLILPIIFHLSEGFVLFNWSKNV